MVADHRKKNEAPNQVRARPEVVVDFDYVEGLLFASMMNVGGTSAYAISVKFDKKVGILGGERKISTLGIFRSLQLLPPGKKLRVFLDSFGSYVGRGEPLDVGVRVNYQDREGEKFSEFIKHDLSVYKDFVEVMGVTNAARDPVTVGSA